MKNFFRYLFHRDHIIIVGSAFLQLSILGVIAFNLDFLNPIADALEDFSITDVFFDIQHSGSEPETCDLITLVDMTELHNRGDIANLLEDINQNDPLYVGVDLIFEGEKDDLLGNEILEGSVMGISEKAVFSSKLTDYNSSANTFKNSVQSYFADRIDITEGYTNLNDDMAGACIRDFSICQTLNGEKQLSFPAKIASIFDESINDLTNDEYLINYKNVKFPVVPYTDIMGNADMIDGHIVLVGAMKEEQDMHNTPLGKMPGMELQAYSLLTLLEHKDIREIPQWTLWMIAFIICYLLELTIDALSQLVNRHKTSMIMVFIKESNVVSIVMLFLWVTLVCWMMYFMFVRHCVSISGGLILGLMALVCTGRDLLKSIVKAIEAKNEDNKFAKSSLFKE